MPKKVQPAGDDWHLKVHMLKVKCSAVNWALILTPFTLTHPLLHLVQNASGLQPYCKFLSWGAENGLYQEVVNEEPVCGASILEYELLHFSYINLIENC